VLTTSLGLKRKPLFHFSEKQKFAFFAKFREHFRFCESFRDKFLFPGWFSQKFSVFEKDFAKNFSFRLKFSFSRKFSFSPKSVLPKTQFFVMVFRQHPQVFRIWIHIHVAPGSAFRMENFAKTFAIFDRIRLLKTSGSSQTISKPPQSRETIP
jgi:hypothetical protein